MNYRTRVPDAFNTLRDTTGGSDLSALLDYVRALRPFLTDSTYDALVSELVQSSGKARSSAPVRPPIVTK